MNDHIEKIEKKTTEQQSIYTDENYKKLVKIANAIREETKLDNNAEDFKRNKEEIKSRIKKINDTYNFMPSYGMFLNKLIHEESLEKAKQTIKTYILENNIQGYSPDIRVIINALMTDENINTVENDIIEKMKLINDM